MEENNSQKAQEEQEIDLIELAQKIWKERKLICKVCGVAVVVALVVAFSIPKEFQTVVKLAPESTDGSKNLGNLGGLAAMARINLGSATTADAISPDLYPDVVQSTPFILELLPVEVTDLEKNYTVSLFEYMDEHQKRAWWGYIIKAPFDLLGLLRGLVTPEEPPSDGTLNPFFLTQEQEMVIKDLRERIAVSVDKKTYVITASVEMQDPLISAQIAQLVVEKLQNYITDYRTQKAKQDYEFTKQVHEEAKGTYYKAQQVYAAFEDGNKNIISASYRTEKERLKNDMDLAYNIYNTLAQKLEQDRLKVQERTPVYTVIEPATVPLKASSPKKLLILIEFVFLAGVGAVGWILFKDAIFNNG